jgi:porphobilinogen synthase
MATLGLRRLRLNQNIRELTREIRVHPDQFIQPLFVVEGISAREAVPGLEEVYRETPASLLQQVEQDIRRGVRKFLLFGVPKDKNTNQFSFAFTANQVRALREKFGTDIWLAVDVCLCSSTTHGHCGVVSENGAMVINDASVDILTQQALEYAAAGADCVAPSDMMDGRIGAIRDALDASEYTNTILMSYSAKFHSNFYGPFRLAADSAPADDISLKDRASYQLDPGRARDALQCALRDDEEGADILMVKPGLPYLDILAELSAAIPKPWAVYQTSGESAAINLLSKEQLASRAGANVEAWTAFVRSGASIIISYDARNAAEWLG